MSRRRTWWIALAALAAAQLVFLAVFQAVQRTAMDEGLAGEWEIRSELASGLVVERPLGERQEVPARSDRFRLIHFWATWCPPCRAEMPGLSQLARRHPRRLQVWAVSTDPEWGAIDRFFKGHIPAFVVRDPTGDAYRAYNVSGLPDSYLVDPSGRVVARFPGEQRWGSSEINEILDHLMTKS